jgi:putative SOS response-associated peptidase YedK
MKFLSQIMSVFCRNRENRHKKICGRFTRKEKFDLLAEQLGLNVCPLCEPRYNIAPSQMLVCIRTNPETKDREFKELQ